MCRSIIDKKSNIKFIISIILKKQNIYQEFVFILLSQTLTLLLYIIINPESNPYY